MSIQLAYQYRQLEHEGLIRLFKLLPASDQSTDLRGELSVCERSSAPEYEALSYVWGKDEFPETINLPEGYIKITDNLAAALRGLRLADEPRLLWTDALCINQSDIQEKESQVAQMANIYREAAGVLAWLGQSATQRLDVEQLCSLSRRTEEIGLVAVNDANAETMRSWAYGNSERVHWMLSIMDVVKGANFHLVYDSPWFTRMWIVQEALLAKELKLCYGANTLEWDVFQGCMILLHTVESAIGSSMLSREAFLKHAWKLVEVRQRWRDPTRVAAQPAAEVASWMYILRQRLCKDDRDRVYALQGLLPSGSDLLIRPDYSKSTKEVYTELTQVQLKAGYVEVLYRAGLCNRKATMLGHQLNRRVSQIQDPETLPTWVPDFRSNKAYLELSPTFTDTFGSDSEISPKFDFTGSPYSIACEATIIDLITTIIPAAFVHREEFRTNDIHMFYACRQFCMHCKSTFDTFFNNRPYPSGDDLLNAFATSFIGGGNSEDFRTSFKVHGDDVPTPLDLWLAFDKHCIREDGDVYRSIQQEAERPWDPARRTVRGLGIEFYKREETREASRAWNYFEFLKRLLRRHYFFLSDDGYAGLAPLQTQAPTGSAGDATDFIAFIEGANVPFVLRDQGEDADSHLLIGPCYVHSVMSCKEAKESGKFSEGRIRIA